MISNGSAVSINGGRSKQKETAADKNRGKGARKSPMDVRGRKYYQYVCSAECPSAVYQCMDPMEVLIELANDSRCTSDEQEAGMFLWIGQFWGFGVRA